MTENRRRHWQEVIDTARSHPELAKVWKEEIRRYDRDQLSEVVLREIEADVANLTQPDVRPMHRTWDEIKDTGGYGTQYISSMDPNRSQNNRFD